MELEPGATFERMTILGRLDRGSAGPVYWAEERRVGNLTLEFVSTEERAEQSRHAAFVEHFLNGAATAARVEHPHILPVHRFGRHGDYLWVSQQPAPASDFLSRLRGGEHFKCLPILKAAAAALDYLHLNRVVYGVLGPRDIYVDDTAVLLNLGMKWILGGWQTRRDAEAPEGAITGNTTYDCVERIQKGQVVGPPCDVYCLGLLAFEALAGCRAFGEGPTPISDMYRKSHDDLFTPPTLRLPVPALAVLRKCLTADPSRRWPSATAFVAALEQTLT